MFDFNIHECAKGPRYGKIVNSCRTARDAIECADQMHAKDGKHYAVVRGSLVCLYTTFDLVHPDYLTQ